MRFLLAPFLLFFAIGLVSLRHACWRRNPGHSSGNPAVRAFARPVPHSAVGCLHGWKPPFRDPKHGLESIADCNFTFAGFVSPQDLPLCEKLGLAAIMAPTKGDEPWFGKWREMSDEEIDQTVKEMVEKAGDSKAVLGYFIMDEPGAPAFPALAKAVAAVKKYAPGKLAYINLFPSYATVGAPDKSQLGTATYTEYLERFVNEVQPQILSYDNYMVQYSDDLVDTQKAAIYYADLLEIRRVAQKYGLPFWNIVSCNQIRKQTTIPSPANLAFQAYTTLAAGGRGVSWYKYYQDGYAYAPIDDSGEKTADVAVPPSGQSPVASAGADDESTDFHGRLLHVAASGDRPAAVAGNGREGRPVDRFAPRACPTPSRQSWWASFGTNRGGIA